MDRVDKILNHDLFRFHLQNNSEAEKDRKFCKHGLEHSLDVARIAEIINLEEELGLNREWIYAAALLHDLGRHLQYQMGEVGDHRLVSGQIAPNILLECGFDHSETSVIVSAIKNHRNEDIAQERSLDGVLYRADKASRTCFACDAEAECYWKKEKKNFSLKY